jgi:hypothetical protein
MINKIDKERRRSMNVAPPDPATSVSGKEPRGTPNKLNRVVAGVSCTNYFWYLEILYSTRLENFNLLYIHEKIEIIYINNIIYSVSDAKCISTED